MPFNSSPEQLCVYCMEISFNFDILMKDTPTYRLGTWSWVQKSYCPFCRLCRLAVSGAFNRKGSRATPLRLKDGDELSVRWGRGGTPGERGAFFLLPGHQLICFEAKDPLSLSAPAIVQHPKFLLPVVERTADLSRITRWLVSCTTEHPNTCRTDEGGKFEDIFSGLDVIRFIDVKEGCIVEVREMMRYVALSYVWGGVDSFRLTVANRLMLLKPGSLKTHGDRLPVTIADAITLVRKLGLRFLWVDSLCLVQNDPNDLQRGTEVMDLVYERSWFTIIAACGHDANAGLPGVHPHSRRTELPTIEVRPGTSLGVYSDLDYLIKRSVHYTRAWTFQESMLSRRTLYFVSDKIFYRCSNSDFSESCLDHVYNDSGLGTPSYSSLESMVTNLEDPMSDFAMMLAYYSEKVLANQSDVLRALAGIMRKVSIEAKTRFLEGLPTVALDAFLLFRSTKAVNLRRRSGFPSYSWAGWRGQLSPLWIDKHLEFSQDELNHFLAQETWIVWYKRSPSGITNLVLDPAAIELGRFSGKLNMLSTSKGGYFKSKAPPLNIATVRTAPTENLSITVSVPSYPLLQFWTVSVSYQLSDINVLDGTSHLVGKLFEECGVMSLDGFEESSFFAADKPYEVILLSGLSIINVLLIEWDGGIAERRGVGTLEPKAISLSLTPPCWKEIVLG